MKLEITKVNYKLVGQRINKLRKAHNMTTVALAKELGISEQAIYHWYDGRNCPNVDNLVTIADMFDTTVDQILGRSI